MLQVQSAMQSLERVEQQLRSGTLDEGAAALKLVTYSAAELKACYAFIDQLEQSVHQLACSWRQPSAALRCSSAVSGCPRRSPTFHRPCSPTTSLRGRYGGARARRATGPA